MRYKEVSDTLRKQRPTGIWASNILGTKASKAQGIKGPGTVAQYRRLLELGLPTDHRAFRLTERIFFRLLSRDADPKLLFEYQKEAKTYPELAVWARELMGEGVAAALAQANHRQDPRVRGAAHRIVTRESHFLRSDLATNPFVRRGSRTILAPGASPPTIFSVAMMAHMPRLQRERAGFVERLVSYVVHPAPRRTFVILAGKKVVKPLYYILGDPLKLDSAGRPKDIPFALHWMELLARLGHLDASSSAQRALGRLIKDCDEEGVWSPKNLRAIPKSQSNLVDFAFPLEPNGSTAARRRADVTFRLAVIARLAGLELEFT